MSSSLELRMRRLEATRRELLGRLASVPDEVLNRAPDPPAWSVAQVLCHVVRAEELSVSYLERKGADEAPSAGWWSAAKSSLLSLALRSPLRFKAPALAADVPERASLDEIARRWGRTREALARLVSTLGEDAGRRAVYHHPRAGRLSLDQALRFLQDHLDHHVRQVERTLASVDRGGSAE